jgi:DNA end-binding protein Ku
MAARYSWKGYLKLSLVSCPVHLAPAASTRERVSFHLLNPQTHNRIQQRTVDPETEKEVPRNELVRGYEFEKGRYVIVEPEELEALQIESSQTIDLLRFVEASEVEPVYFNAAYYLGPDGKMADETFRVIREAMAATGRAGIGRVVLSQREHPVLVEPHGEGMMMLTLRPADEVRDASEYFADIGKGKLDKEMVDLAKKIIEQKSGPFEPKELTGDHYQDALRELVAQKIKGGKPVIPKAASAPSNVVNLMDALRKSIAGDDDTASRRRPAASGPARGRGATPAADPAFAAAKPKRKRRAS